MENAVVVEKRKVGRPKGSVNPDSKRQQKLRERAVKELKTESV